MRFAMSYYPAFENIEKLSEYELAKRSLGNISWFLLAYKRNPQVFSENLLTNFLYTRPEYYCHIDNPTKNMQIEMAKQGRLNMLYRKNIHTAFEKRAIDYALVIMAIDARPYCILEAQFATGCDPKCFLDETVQEHIVKNHRNLFNHLPTKLPKAQRLYDLISILET